VPLMRQDALTVMCVTTAAFALEQECWAMLGEFIGFSGNTGGVLQL
jgi:hypothetical protein